MSIQKINKVKANINVARLAAAVAYSPETGGFRWRQRPLEHFDSKAKADRWNGKYAGKAAFTSKCPRGYVRGCIDGNTIYAHRAAVALNTGKWPDLQIDHINRVKWDNRAVNLREVSHSENRKNTPDYERAQSARSVHAPSSNPEKCKPFGVGIRRQSKTTWSARVKIEGVEQYLGSFKCLGQAITARAAR